MEGKKEKQKVAITIVMIIMALAMGFVAAIIISKNPRANTPPFPIFCISNMFEAVAAGIILAQIVPFDKIGRRIEARTGTRCPSFKFILFNSIPFALIGSVIVNMIVCFVNVLMSRTSIPKDQAPPFILMYLSSIGPILIPSLIICYLVAVAATPLVYKILGIKAPKE